MVIRFGYLNAANNWWWALDNLEIREGMDSTAIPPQAVLPEVV